MSLKGFRLNHCNRSSGRGIISWPLLVGLCAFFDLLFRAAKSSLLDPDTYLHITVGEWIIKHQAVPAADIFSHTRPDAPWVPHEWLAEVILNAVYHNVGWNGLHLCAVALAAGCLAWITRFLLNRGVPAIYALLFTALSLPALFSHLLARPHLLAWPLLLIWVGQLVLASENRRKPSLWLLIVIALWANLHGSFVLGLAFVLPIGLEAILQSSRQERVATSRSWALFFALACLSSLLTPFGLNGWHFAYDLLTQPSLQQIDEWKAANLSQFNPLHVWIAALFTLTGLGLLKLSPIRILMILGLLFEALAHVRYVSIVGLLVPILIATPFRLQYAIFTAQQTQQHSRLDQFFTRISAPALRLSSFTFWVLAAGIGLAATHSYIKPLPPTKYAPHQALQFARGAGLAQAPVFNEYGYGGYLIAQGIPVFVDGRADMYSSAFLKAYFEAIDPSNLTDFTAYTDQYGIAWTLLPQKNFLVNYLSASADWKVVYEDEASIIHQRVKRATTASAQ